MNLKTSRIRNFDFATRLGLGLFWFFCLPLAAVIVNDPRYPQVPPEELIPQSCKLETFRSDGRWHFFCSATLVGKTDLLTDGHCFLQATGSVRAICDRGKEIRKIIRHSIIPRYQSALFEARKRLRPFEHLNAFTGDDLAVLNTALPFTTPPLRLPHSRTEFDQIVLRGGECRLHGYGLDQNNVVGNPNGVRLRIVNLSRGVNEFLEYALPDQSPTRRGDSGTGLICWDRFGDMRVVGAVLGQGLATSVRKNLDWIKRQLSHGTDRYEEIDPETGYLNRVEDPKVGRTYLWIRPKTRGLEEKMWVLIDDFGEAVPLPSRAGPTANSESRTPLIPNLSLARRGSPLPSLSLVPKSPDHGIDVELPPSLRLRRPH